VTLEPGKITAITPTIPPRGLLLGRARASVQAQIRPADAHVIMVDYEHAGPGPTRNAAIDRVETEWIAFLDDDDEWLPHHLRALEKQAFWTGADVIYPIGRYDQMGDDPLQQSGRPFDPHRLRAGNYIPVTVLARTQAVRDAGGFPDTEHAPRMGWQSCEDWGLWLRMLDNGATFAPLHQVTWLCHTHGGPYGNTSGAPWRNHHEDREAAATPPREVWEEELTGITGPKPPEGSSRAASRGKRKRHR